MKTFHDELWFLNNRLGLYRYLFFVLFLYQNLTIYKRLEMVSKKYQIENFIQKTISKFFIKKLRFIITIIIYENRYPQSMRTDPCHVEIDTVPKFQLSIFNFNIKSLFALFLIILLITRVRSIIFYTYGFN